MMSIADINFVAVVAAAIASWIFGAGWYMALGRVWMEAVGFTEPPKPTAAPFVISFVAGLAMAAVLAGLIAHSGAVTVGRGLITGFFAWLGFVATTVTVNHRYQGSGWNLTFIDSGHWLGALLVQGLVIGLFG
jgi:hypothetical protein